MFMNINTDEELESAKFERKYGADCGYVGDCPNCGRVRLIKFSKGFHICEKCHWCVEEDNYCSHWSD